MVKILEISDWWVPVCKWDIYITYSLQGSGNSVEEEHREGKRQRGAGKCCLVAMAVMNSQGLWWLPPDPQEVQTADIPARTRKGFVRLHPHLWNYSQKMAAGEGSFFSGGGATSRLPHTSFHGPTSMNMQVSLIRFSGHLKEEKDMKLSRGSLRGVWVEWEGR